MFNQSKLFSLMREQIFNGSIKDQRTVETITTMLNVWESKYASSPIEFLAYAFATAYHETQFVLYPNKELGGPQYLTRMYDIRGDRPTLAKRYGNIHPGDGILFAGKGLVHITWRNNYRKMGNKLGVNLEDNPNLALDINIAVLILFEGMFTGLFTGVSLYDCYTNGSFNAIKARKIINGTDKAKEISEYYYTFLAILENSFEDKPKVENTNTGNEVTVNHGAGNVTYVLNSLKQLSELQAGDTCMNNTQVNMEPEFITIHPKEYADFMAYKDKMENTKPAIQSKTINTVLFGLISVAATHFGLSKYVDPATLNDIITGIASIGFTIIGIIRARETEPKQLRFRGQLP